METKEKIYLSSPHMGKHEFEFIREAFDTNWISPVGPHIKAFEEELAAYNKIPHCAALSSGTAAIHLALIVLGVEKGDEVICSSFTFSASCNPIVYQGATPVFVDSEMDTWNMDPELLEYAINDRIVKGRKPKAIVLVHLYGMPAKIKEILQVASKFEIPIIEDAAEALGSEYFGQKVGTFGELSIFSFNGNKIITTSGGGALVSNNEKWVSKARFLSTQARDNAPHYEHSHIGYNYRLSNVLAGIGRGQLMVLEDRIKQRRKNFEYYRMKMKNLKGVKFLNEPDGFFANRWLTTVIIDPQFSSSERIRLELDKENIESRPLWKPMHLQPIFKHHPAYVNGVSQELFEKGLCLPSGSNLSEIELNSVIDMIQLHGK